jgi:hypothetical protein
MNYKIDGGADKLTKPSSFNFEDIDVKLTYAKAKFILSAILGLFLGLL